MEHSFVPKDELLASIMGMGYTRNQACWALFRTGNKDIERAVMWILDHPEADIDRPIGADEAASCSDEDPSLEGFLDTNDFFKMVFVVNMDLDMGPGKMAAQVAHAAIGIYKELLHDQHRNGEMLLQWEQFGETKIVLNGHNREHLLELAAKAQSFSLSHHIVTDAGKTQVAAGSMTVLAIMGKCDMVDLVTGELSLL